MQPTTTPEQHSFTPKYEARALAKRTPWGHRGVCTCGATQPGLAGTERDAFCWFYGLHLPTTTTTTEA